MYHQEIPELLPSQLRQLWDARTKINEAIDKPGEAGNAVLVVGHQPLLGCLSPLFIRRSFGWIKRAVPIDSSEIVCLRLKKTRGGKQWRGRLIWTLAPGDQKALDQVADKVKRKMETAKLLSAVITLVLTALLGVLLDVSRWNALAGSKDNPVQASLLGWTYNGQTAARIAFVMLLLAGALYLLTMYSYDRLLMPTRFWAEGLGEPTLKPLKEARWPWLRRPQHWLWHARSWLLSLQRRLWHARRAWLPRRPPSSSAWVVYRNMQRIWYCLFTPANFFVAAALMILASALLRVRLGNWIWATIAFAIVAGWWLWFRPIVGSED